ncbi:MAG: hypothetical protein IJV40_02900 [Oscillospiraceae bacterium]|nr:hypothetical protein [Oscillospiraceae bacterium]
MQEYDWRLLVFSLLITIFFYGLFPLLFAGLRKKPIKRSTFRIICFAFNFLIMAVFLFVTESSTGGPYALWTTVFSGVGISILNNRGLIIEKQKSRKSAKESPDKRKRATNAGSDILVKSLMDMYAHREAVYYRQQPNDPDLGYSLEDPISTCGIDGSKEYLSRLRTKDNQAFTWEREGSFTHPSLPVMVDKYKLYLDGQEDETIYICPYGYSSLYAPAGLYLLPSLPGAKEIVRANLDKTEFRKRISTETADYIKLCEEQAIWKQLKFAAGLSIYDLEILERADAGGLTTQQYLEMCKMQAENCELYFEMYNKTHAKKVRFPVY